MKVGMDTCSLFRFNDEPEKYISLADGFQMLANAGFDCVDFGFFGEQEKFIREHDETEPEFDNYYISVREEAEKRGLKINQTHAPLIAFVDAQGEEYFEVLVRCIKATKLLGAEYIVIHPLQPPTCLYDNGVEYRKEINLKFFRRLQPVLEQYGVIECIENLFRPDPDADGKLVPSSCSRPEEILYYLDELNSDRFGVCLDTGHLLLTGDYTGDTPQGAIRKFGKHLKVLHVHDNFKQKDEHSPPYFGHGDWKEIALALKEVGYDGVFNMELTLYRYMTFNKIGLQELLTFIRKIANPDNMVK